MILTPDTYETAQEFAFAVGNNLALEIVTKCQQKIKNVNI